LLCGALSAAAAPSRGLLDEQSRATQGLLAQRASLGLGDDSSFAVRHAFTNQHGRTVVRLQQTWQGLRVWGGGAIAHIEPDGEMTYVIDATTGALLRKWNDLQSAAPPVYAPALGTGQSYYPGAVSVPMGLAADGTYALADPLRGSLPQPFVAAQGETQVGLTT